MVKGNYKNGVRIGIYLLIAIGLAGVIIGSFLDLKIANFLFSPNNLFGYSLGFAGMLPAYLPLSWIGGFAFAVTLKKDYKIIYKIVLICMAAGMVGAATVLQGLEFVSIDGLNIPNKWYLGIVISALLMIGIAALGYYFGNKCERNEIISVIIVFAVMYLVIWVGASRLLKIIFHRPRFRALMIGVDGLNTETGYRNWWETFSEYESFVSGTLPSDEFRSFPSGHAGAGVIFTMFLTYLPLFTSKEKEKSVLFWIGFCWCILVSFSRITLGAHFFSDVSMGILINSIGFLAADFVLDKKLFAAADNSKRQT